MAKTLSGQLDTFSLADLLQWLEINALSGRVTITRGDVRRTIDLKGGAIVFVSSSRPDERLGLYLVRNGYLSEEDVYGLLAENFVLGKNLTRLILDQGLLPRERLAEAVEKLATQVLLDLFHWSGARFDFDPNQRTENVLQIHLSLRGQVLAFQGVKSVDDSARFRAVSLHAEEAEAPWEKDFHADTLAGTFWSILESLPGEAAAPNDVRDRFYVFNLFADGIHRELREPFRPYPVFDDTAAMIQGILADDADEDRLLQVAALDPFLTLDVLCLANALLVDRKALVGTAREASQVIGSRTFRAFLDLLTGLAAPKTPPTEKVERLVRRSALSTAVAATHVAPCFGIDLETGYTLGLLEPMAVEALLKLLMAIDFPSGPFRAAALERFRPLFGRVLARKLNLPRLHEDVLGSEGRVSATSSGPEQLIFAAKQLSRAEQIGREWSSDDPAMADRFAGIAATPDLSEKIARDTAALREILHL